MVEIREIMTVTRFGLRLRSLPQGDQTREIFGAPTEIWRRLTIALAYAEGW